MISKVANDLTAGLVVFLVAVPLCLGIALASGAPLVSGLIAGIVGGLVVGVLSGSHTSVSGPAAGLTAVVLTQIEVLGSFEAFLAAVFVGGVIQVGLGLAKAGSLARFFPSSVIRGLLAAIGLILILKQIPHLFGIDSDPEGEMSFLQPDNETTFSELTHLLSDIYVPSALIGVVSLVLLVAWGRIRLLRNAPVPGPLAVVLFGVGANSVLRGWGSDWAVGAGHLVSVPVAESVPEILGFIRMADFSQIFNPALYVAAVTIAIVASLETLLNLEAVDKLDQKKRHSPASRELVAQGVGNMTCGLLGGLPVTSVIVRSSVNISSGVETKLSTIFHGVLLVVSAFLLPNWLNMIPLSCLAAILIVTGFKLAAPKLIASMWAAGYAQFIPFAVTVFTIVFTDLLQGVLIGLAIAAGFILWSNLRRPVHRIVEKHLSGEVVRIRLADQVSFLNRAALSQVLDSIPGGSNVLVDATGTEYFDTDVLDLIRDYEQDKAPARGIQLSLVGFNEHGGRISDRIQYIDYSTRELQDAAHPEQVLELLRQGNERFRTGSQLQRDLSRQARATADGQHPLAVVVSCIDSRTPAELILDLGLGDIFSVRVAGNVVGGKELAGIEYGCKVAGAKLILVMGHTRCGAVTAAVELAAEQSDPATATGCQNIEHIVGDIQESIAPGALDGIKEMTPLERQRLIDEVARKNVLAVIQSIRSRSETIDRLIGAGRVSIVGALYKIDTCDIEFLTATGEAN